MQAGRPLLSGFVEGIIADGGLYFTLSRIRYGAFSKTIARRPTGISVELHRFSAALALKSYAVTHSSSLVSLV